MHSDDSVSSVKGIGPKSCEKLAKMDIYTAGDLLRHYPRDYFPYEEPIPVSDVSLDDTGKAAAYDVSLSSGARLIRGRNSDVVIAQAGDPGSGLQIVWYHSPYLARQLKRGMRAVMYGAVVHKGSRRIMEHPQIIDRIRYMEMVGRLLPMYSLTQGLTQNFFRKAIKQILDENSTESDYLPDSVRTARGLPGLNFAVRQIHFPESRENLALARRRLAFDEFLIYLLSVRMLGSMKSLERNAFVIPESVDVSHFISSLPYKLTEAQMRAFKEADADMRGPHVMNRLIQGDVGSGKTIVAALLLIETAMAGYQGCLMAPTEVLARQHYEKFSSMLESSGIKCALLTGSVTGDERQDVYERIASHDADIIIGTHALFQDKVVYDNLALVVTDEQHRFGVRQREMLVGKSRRARPHLLVMSATPIPRTLAMVLYSDLDVSVIDEKPAGRPEVKNCVVGTSYRRAAYKLIADEVRQGHQAYIICPLVEESEGIEAENVEDYTVGLRKIFGPDFRIQGLHGRMSSDEKDSIMKNFSDGNIDILVSTTVVEVGVDVPGATVMMIENAERFGLAQLHQLRGRVGRGRAQSYCIFMHGKISDAGAKRLEVMQESNDGFFIAAQDMKTRGPGDMFGVRQSGEAYFRIADVFSDSRELEEASEEASAIIAEDPDLSRPEHAALRAKLSENAVNGSVVL